MKLFIKYSFIITSLCMQISYAQTAFDALRISDTRSLGSARTIGIGGAIGSLGGDIGSLAINPAAVATFKKSDFSVSFGGSELNTNSTLKTGSSTNSSNLETKFDLDFDGIGLVIVDNKRASNWRQVNFGISVNKIQDFTQKFYFEGKSKGSITDRFLELATDPNNSEIGIDPDDLDAFESGLAYDVGALFEKDTNLPVRYRTDFSPLRDYALQKSGLVEQSGRMHQFDFSIGGNYKDKILLGASLSIPYFSYTYKQSYTESESTQDEFLGFNYLNFVNNYKTTGTGVGLNLGLILKPIQSIRAGIAYQSPVIYNLNDTYKNILTYKFEDGNTIKSYDAESPDGQFVYGFISPAKWVFSLAGVSQLGFITAQAEHKNYNKARYDLTLESDAPGDLAYERILNNEIKKQFQSAWDFKAGAELAIEFLRLRGGIEYLGSPYANNETFRKAYTVGIGLRGNWSYLDIGYRNSIYTEGYIPYATNNSDYDGDGSIDAVQQLVENKITNHFLTATLGFKF